MSDYATQSMTPVSQVYVLPRCDVALYADAGSGVLGALVWTAQQVDNLRVSERFNEVEHFATGVPYAETHHLDGKHELTFDATWNVAAALARNTSYILAVTFNNANLNGANAWVRRFYSGVTTSSRDIASRDANEFGSSNTLRAQYYVETTGSGTPPAIGPGTETC